MLNVGSAVWGKVGRRRAWGHNVSPCCCWTSASTAHNTARQYCSQYWLTILLDNIAWQYCLTILLTIMLDNTAWQYFSTILLHYLTILLNNTAWQCWVAILLAILLLSIFQSKYLNPWGAITAPRGSSSNYTHNIIACLASRCLR